MIKNNVKSKQIVKPKTSCFGQICCRPKKPSSQNKQSAGGYNRMMTWIVLTRIMLKANYWEDDDSYDYGNSEFLNRLWLWSSLWWLWSIWSLVWSRWKGGHDFEWSTWYLVLSWWKDDHDFWSWFWSWSSPWHVKVGAHLAPQSPLNRVV